jgi:hypothetical protein
VTKSPSSTSHNGLALVVGVIAVVAVAIGFTACAPTEEEATAYAMTSVRNSGIPGGSSQFVDVRRDNGLTTAIYPGDTLWGASAVLIRNGMCVSINGAKAVCSTSGTKTVTLGLNAYTVRRTK